MVIYFFQNKGNLCVFEEAASGEKTLIIVRTPDNQPLKESRVEGGFVSRRPPETVFCRLRPRGLPWALGRSESRWGGLL